MGLVSISLSSGFSFQADVRFASACQRFGCFHLVIERLLISGDDSLAKVATYIWFQSRYRAASHFRSGEDGDSLAAIYKFQSRYRAASHFRLAVKICASPLAMFQSRYRAASHFR